MSTIMVNVKDLKVGDKIKPIEVPGVTDVSGLGIGVVTRNNTETTVPHIMADFRSPAGTLNFVVYQWELVECADATPAEQQDNEIERLKARIKELEDATTGQVLMIGDLKSALKIVNERLNQEAEHRGWCSEFNDILDQVNSRIENEANGCFTLEGNTKEYEVLVEGEATVSWTYTVTVEARSEDDAIWKVEDNPSSYFDMDDAAEGEVSYGSGWYTNEVSEVSIA